MKIFSEDEAMISGSFGGGSEASSLAGKSPIAEDPPVKARKMSFKVSEIIKDLKIFLIFNPF